MQLEKALIKVVEELRGYTDLQTEQIKKSIEEALNGLEEVRKLASEKPIDGKDGLPGANGQDGKDADPLEVAKAVMNDPAFLLNVRGEKGEQGPAGSDGKDGTSVTVDEVKSALTIDMDFIKSITGPKGEDGLSIKAVELSDAGYLTLEFDDGQLIELGCIKGMDGKDGSDGKDGVDGQDGESFNAEEFYKVFKADSELIDSLKADPEFVKAHIDAVIKEASEELSTAVAVAKTKTMQLEMAIDQVNTAKVKTYEPEVLYKQGQWLEHKGRYYVANRDTDSVPGDSTAYSLVLRGFEFKKAWSADTKYERLDVVISATGSAWVANKDAPQGEPGSTPDWNLLVKRGERGAKGDIGAAGPKGEKGDRGEQGPAGKDAEFDLEDVTKAALAEFLGSQPVYEVPISSFEGFWHADVSYNKGAVVHFGDGLWVAKKASRNIAPREFLNSPKLIQSRETWQLMFELPPGFDPSLISGAINGFNNLTQQVQSLLTGVSHETAVLDVLAAPPANPLDGDIYMVGLNPTGAWAGQANSVAIYDAGNWVFTPPQQTGETHHVTTKNTTLTWNGTRYVQTASGVASSISATPPTNPRGGDLWLDTSSTPSQLKVYNGAGWTNTSNGTRTVTSPTDPQASMVPKNGDIWVKPEVPAAGTNPRQPAEVRSWLNGAWVVGTPTVPASSRTYVQAAAPTGATDGDLWIQHVTGQKDIYYHFIAGAWVNDAGTRTFVQDADPAAAAVEGDIWTNITAPVATKVRHNGAWVAPAAAPTIPSGTPVITVGAGVAAARATTGDQYYNSGNGQFYVYDGTNWVQPGPKFLQITQAAYTALATKDSNTLYIIVG